MTRLLGLLLATCIPAIAGLSSIADEIGNLVLDPNECYRVRDLSFTRGGDLRYYFNNGFLVLSKPVAGRRIAAVFYGEVDGGDAEMIVMPPTKGERLSLSSFAGSPNLSEHFRQALFLFTDDSADALVEAIRARGEVTKNPDRGLLVARDWNSMVQNFSRSFSLRLTQHMAESVPTERGFFYGAIQGRKLGNFDVYYDPESTEQIFLGALENKDNRVFYDTWTNFRARAFRTGARPQPLPALEINSYQIEAVLDANLHLRVVTKAQVKVLGGKVRVGSFEISPNMKITGVRVNGEEAEIFSPESMRVNLIRNAGASGFLVNCPDGLSEGRAYDFVFEHEGDVVRNAGHNVYFVGSRSNWYPRSGTGFARFDLTFTYPNSLQLVFPGEIKEDKVDGSEHITRRVTNSPIRVAGFNLGQYQSSKVQRGNLSVEVFANKQVESALANTRRDVILAPPPSPFPRNPRQQRDTVPTVAVVPPPNPLSRLETLTNEVAGAFEFLASQLGPPALPNLMVAPIPGSFGQGFSGLVYLSTLSYLNPSERPLVTRETKQDVFFSELLHAHETAHQWWGNVVTSASFQDDWLMEALANYSSVMLLEKKKGPAALRSQMEEYRDRLIARNPEGKVVDSAGPISLGPRLQSSLAPDSWRSIIYGKGSWILHMLRRRMGDQAFFAMLGEICKRYRFQPMSVKQFQGVAASYMPKGAADPKLENFFETWVESPGIPAITLETAVAGKAPNVKLTIKLSHKEVDEAATIEVPVEVQTVRGKSDIYWLRTGGDEPNVTTIALKAPPFKVALDPDLSVLRR